MMPGFIGRTPVYDRAFNLFAYELHPCSLPCQDEAQPERFFKQIWQTLRLERLTGGQPGLIRLPLALLPELPSLPWPKEKLIVYLPQETLTLLTSEQVNRLASQGWLIAISSDHYDSQLAKDLEFAYIWALRAGAPLAAIQTELAALQAKGVKLLVREVETRDQYEAAFAAGFDYFQGRYFEFPRLIHGTHLPANRLAMLHLIARLYDPKVTIEEIEDLIRQDMTLSYKLLRLINAAFYGLPKKVDSLRRAVIFLGLNRIKHWAMVVVVNAIDYKPQELLITALVRAQTCEAIANQLGRSDAEPCYIAGLFSLLDAIMDAPMEEILKHLNLIDEINQALLYGGGPIGQVLQTTLSLEHGLCHKLPLAGLNLEATLTAYLDAIDQAEAIRRQLQVQSK
ncbi:MAG: HDOD domain-containing protein [Methylohalobius sp.]|nr:HDOD domain-containing protein [Methylohalobius sp.]